MDNNDTFPSKQKRQNQDQNQDQNQIMSTETKEKLTMQPLSVNFLRTHGGYAFPCGDTNVLNNDGTTDYYYGMNLREYFAGQALGAMNCDFAESKAAQTQLAIHLASFAYLIADAMIAESNKG